MDDALCRLGTVFLATCVSRALQNCQYRKKHVLSNRGD